MSDGWEDIPTSASGEDEGWEDISTEQEKTKRQLAKIADVGGGVLETLTTGAVGAFGGIGASAYGSVKGMLDPNKTASQGMEEAQKAFADSTFSKLMAPQTKTGHAIEEWFTKGVEGWKEDAATLAELPPDSKAPEWAKAARRAYFAAVSTAPEAMMLGPLARGGRGAKAEAPKPKKGLDADAMFKEEPTPAAAAADRPTSNENPLFVDRNGVVFDKLDDTARMARNQQRWEQINQGLDPEFINSEKARIAQELANQSDAAIVERLKNLDKEITAKERRSAAEGTVRTAEDPLFVDPQAQAFRGDPREANARLALEREGEAFDNAATHNQFGKEGEPLPLLTTEQLRLSNEGPQATPAEIINTTMRENMAEAAAMEHPLVRKAVERVTKQEELIVKINELMTEGRATRNQLKRAEQDLANFEQSLQRTIQNTSRAKKDGKRAIPFNFKRQRGAVNLQALIEESPRLRDLFHRMGRNEKLTSREQALLRALEKDDNLGFDTPRQALKNLIEAPQGDWQVSPGTKAAITNLPRSQRGAVNPDVFKEGFQKLKQLADGTWLRAHSDGQSLTIEAIKDSRKLGGAVFEKTDKWNEPSKTDMAATMVGSKQKGIATEVYRFASELGNDVIPSKIRTKEGSAMWEGFERKGLAEDGTIKSPGNKQAGFLSFNDIVKAFPSFANSKVKKPLYRGTRTDYKYPERVRETGALGRGVYLTESPSFASTFAGGGDGANVRAAYINLQNPLVLDQSKRDVIRQMHFTMDKEQSQKYTDSLIKKGHDGVIVMLDGEVKEAVIFDPDNVKNAFAIDDVGTIKSPGNKQTGAIFTNPEQKKTLDSVGAIEKILGPIAPRKLSKEEVIEFAKKEKDIDQNMAQKFFNHLTKGGLYQALKTDNSLVRFANEKVLEADRFSRADIDAFLHDRENGLGQSFRALSKEEFIQVHKAIDMADFTQTELTFERLRQFGATDKQIKAIQIHRQVMDKSFEMLNEARKEAGLEPVSKRVAYAAMRATGDYRKLVYKGSTEDGSPKIVGMIGSNFRARTNNLAKQLEERGYTVGEERYVGGVPRERGSTQEAFMQALEFLADKDPDVKTLMETVGEVMTQEAYNMLNMKVHAEAKKGIFGMEGRKKVGGVDWASDYRNAKEGLTAQMQHAEMAIKWGHMSKAAREIREILTDKDINQPIAKRWVEGYLQNALGFNPSKAGRYAERMVAEYMGSTGVGFSNVRQLMSGSRKVVNTVLLGLNPMFWATNVVQPMAAMPGMKQYLITKGLRPDFDFGTGYSYITRGGSTAMKINAGLKLSELEANAHKYAKSRHVYGSDLVEHSNRARKDFPFYAERVGNFVTGSIESATRRTMFYSFVHMLADNGMSVKNGLFESAHNLTDMTMNNYSAVERPNLYNALGPVGDTAANLASFKHNELSRVALYARQLKEEKSARPLLAQLATGAAFSGILGTLAFEEADWLYKQITSMLGKPDSLAARVIQMSESLPIGDNKHALSHGGFSFLGLDMTKRLGLSNMAPDNLGEALFPGGSKLVEMGSTAIDAIRDPSEMNIKQAVRAAAPGIATGVMDRAWFSKQTAQGEMANNRNTLEGQGIRTTTDKIWKSVGGTGVNESVQKAKLYETEWMKKAFAEKRKKHLTKAHEQLYTTGRVDPTTVQAYLDNEGDIKTLMADISRTLKNQNVSAKDRELLKNSMSQSITSLRHAQRLREAFKE